MKKGFLDGALMAAVAFALFIAGVFAAAFIKDPPTKGADWASWVQAFGSVAAILGAYWFGERQAKANLDSAIKMQALAEQKRQDAYLAIATAACGYVELLNQSFHDGMVNKLTFSMNYNETRLADLVSSMAAVPVHELGGADKVIAWIATKNGLTYFEQAARKYLDHMNEYPGNESMPAEVPGSPRMVTLCGNSLAYQYQGLLRAMKGV